MSQAIINAPVIVFAGAGASAHLNYPVATKFRELLDSKVAGVDTFTQEVWRVVTQGVKKADFEEVYDRLEAILEAQQFFVAMRDDDTEQRVTDSVGDLKRLVEESTIEAFGVGPDPTAMTPFWPHPVSICWGRLLDLIHPGEGQVVPIFTTNYDISFEFLRKSLDTSYHIEVEDAFDRDEPGSYPWRRWQLYRWKPESGKRHVWLFRLHGCVGLERPPACQGRFTPACLYLDRDGLPATDISAGDRPLLWWSKQKRPFQDPFWTEYRYFLRCLDRAKLLIILGYGLQDEHIVRAIQESLHANQELRVLVFDRDVHGPRYLKLFGPGRRGKHRVAFVKLSFDLEPMCRLEHILHDGPLDIEAALRAVAWCSVHPERVPPEDAVKSVDLRSGRDPYKPEHSDRWKGGCSPSEVVYQRGSGSSDHGFYALDLDPRQLWEGEVTIKVADAGLASWGAIGLGGEAVAGSYPGFYGIENQGGDVKLRFSDSRGPSHREERADLRNLDVDGRRTNERRIWFRTSKHTVEIAALDKAGCVIAAYREKATDGLRLRRIMLAAGETNPDRRVVFHDLKVREPK